MQSTESLGWIYVGAVATSSVVSTDLSPLYALWLISTSVEALSIVYCMQVEHKPDIQKIHHQCQS